MEEDRVPLEIEAKSPFFENEIVAVRSTGEILLYRPGQKNFAYPDDALRKANRKERRLFVAEYKRRASKVAKVAPKQEEGVGL